VGVCRVFQHRGAHWRLLGELRRFADRYDGAGRLRWRRDEESWSTLFDADGVPSDAVPRRAVLAGEVRSGKRTACLMVCRALVKDSGPVPVLLSASSWRAGAQEVNCGSCSE
jgi:hypothetical protein